MSRYGNGQWLKKEGGGPSRGLSEFAVVSSKEELRHRSPPADGHRSKCLSSVPEQRLSRVGPVVVYTLPGRLDLWNPKFVVCVI